MGNAGIICCCAKNTEPYKALFFDHKKAVYSPAFLAFHGNERHYHLFH